MTKKQFLSTALAGLITLNILGGCSNKVNSNIPSTSSSTEYQTTRDVNGFNNNVVEKLIGSFEEKVIETYLDATITEEIDYEDYKILNIDLSEFYNEKGQLVIELPYGYIEKDVCAYKVSKKVTYTQTYPATVTVLEDGTKMYYAQFGGILSGTNAILTATKYEAVPEEEATEVLNKYLDVNINKK